MAAGDQLLDADGNVILDDDGNVMLSDGGGDECCCAPDPCTCQTADPAVSVSSITRSGTTATATLADNPYITNHRVIIVGASPAGYNGNPITVLSAPPTTATTFPYTVSSGLSTPATGTITAQHWLPATNLICNLCTCGPAEVTVELEGVSLCTGCVVGSGVREHIDSGALFASICPKWLVACRWSTNYYGITGGTYALADTTCSGAPLVSYPFALVQVTRLNFSPDLLQLDVGFTSGGSFTTSLFYGHVSTTTDCDGEVEIPNQLSTCGQSQQFLDPNGNLLATRRAMGLGGIARIRACCAEEGI